MNAWKQGNQRNVKGQWSEQSTNEFIKYLTDGAKTGRIFTDISNSKSKIDWMKISRDFGRKGESCYDKYMSLKKKN